MKAATLFFSTIAIAGAAVSVGAVAWIVHKKSQQDTLDARVVIEGVEKKELSVSLEDFCPGYSTSYSVLLQGKENLRLQIAFRPEEEVSLAPYIDVQILWDTECLSQGKLSEYLAGKETEFVGNFTQVSEQEIQIVYSMGLDIGDEAQNAVAEFKLILDSKEA